MDFTTRFAKDADPPASASPRLSARHEGWPEVQLMAGRGLREACYLMCREILPNQKPLPRGSGLGFFLVGSQKTRKWFDFEETKD